VEDGVLVTRAHIHCAPADSNGPLVVALLEHKDGGVSTVRLSEDVELEATITNESISNNACGATLSAIAAEMSNGNTYVNVHTVDNPGGEIRGQIEEK
ncbi:MAG: CHRD domain-containing protein, partial [Candidatus Methylomirabilales bacterium]